MKVPLLDLQRQLEPLRTEIEAAISEVVSSTVYILGPKVEELETRIAEYCGVEHAIGVSSGTDALLAALMALGVGTGDIVVTTPYSFFASVGSIVRLGATPALVDVDPETLNIDPNALARWFAENSGRIPRVKAIMPVHLFGQCAEMDPILDIADRHGIAVVEDAAQALGATYPSRRGPCKAGSMGTLGCFSFFPSKNLGAMGDGGMVVTSDDDLAETVRKVRAHGAKPKYVHSLVGGNFRLDAMQAAILGVKLPSLESWHSARRRNAQFYDERLQAVPVRPLRARWGAPHHIYNQYVVIAEERRSDLRRFLESRGVQTEVYYPVPLHLQECFRNLGHRPGAFPHSERAAAQSLALPIYPELTEDEKRYVVQTIEEFYAS